MQNIAWASQELSHQFSLVDLSKKCSRQLLIDFPPRTGTEVTKYSTLFKDTGTVSPYNDLTTHKFIRQFQCHCQIFSCGGRQFDGDTQLDAAYHCARFDEIKGVGHKWVQINDLNSNRLFKGICNNPFDYCSLKLIIARLRPAFGVINQGLESEYTLISGGFREPSNGGPVKMEV